MSPLQEHNTEEHLKTKKGTPHSFQLPLTSLSLFSLLLSLCSLSRLCPPLSPSHFAIPPTIPLIDKDSESPLCKMCGSNKETISHIVNECCKSLQKNYKWCRDNVAKYFDWRVENPVLAQHENGTSRKQNASLKIMNIRTCVILQFYVTP